MTILKTAWGEYETEKKKKQLSFTLSLPQRQGIF